MEPGTWCALGLAWLSSVAFAKGTNPSILDQDGLWKDVTPIHEDETECQLVRIALHPEYRKAAGLLRALMKQNELSERALGLTSVILKVNGSHYPAWNYRLQILKHLHETDPAGPHLRKEMMFMNQSMHQMRKSYQAWHHRAAIVALLDDPLNEIGFVNQMLKSDAKNYHTWTHRQSLLCQFNRPEIWAGELPFNEELLGKDTRNNSAWNHRFFLVFHTINLRYPEMCASEFNMIVRREIEFAKQQIFQAPNNLSAWNYLRGVLKRACLPLGGLEAFVLPLTKTAQQLDKEASWPPGLNKSSNLPVPAAVEFLANIFAEDRSKTAEALALYTLLAEKLDPIRKGYWEYCSLMAVRQATTKA